MIPIRYNLRSLAVRRTTTIATAAGVGLAVCVFSGAQMLANGIQETLASSGEEDVAIVLSRGSDAELSSSLQQSTVGLVESVPGVRQRSDGTADAVGEVVGVLALDKVGTDGVSNVQIRGVEESVWEFRPTARIAEGRAPRPGTDEAVVGRAIRGRFRGLEIGQSFEIRRNRPVQIVGVLEADGSSFESEVWADLETVRSGFGRETLVSAVRVRLESAEAFETFERGVEADRRLGLQAFRETQYYEDQSEGTATFIRVLGMMIAFFFSIGGIIGAMITMYASVANRTREIGTLRALGFSRGGILVSFLLESTMLALIGGVLGISLSLAMGMIEISMINFQSWSEVVFSFEATPSILGSSLAAAAVIGVIGGLFPALRAARTSPIQAMRG
jgi:putative ABC transport system permease protein